MLSDYLRAGLRRTALRPLVRRWRTARRHSREIREWQLAGRPAPPPHCIKQRVLRQYAAKYNLKTFVETGTYFGDMVEALCDTFDEIYSIELSSQLHAAARARFDASPNVVLFNGDSANLLPDVLDRLRGPTLFWLDGHYSGDITACGEKQTPILDELRHILSRPEAGHVVIIDDARCFGVDPAYPTIAEVEALVREFRPAGGVVCEDDSIRITPARELASLPAST